MIDQLAKISCSVTSHRGDPLLRRQQRQRPSGAEENAGAALSEPGEPRRTRQQAPSAGPSRRGWPLSSSMDGFSQESRR